MPLKRDASLPSDWDRMLEGLEPRSYRSIKELEAALDEHLGSESPPGVRFSGQNALKVLEAESWLRRDGQEVQDRKSVV